MEILKSDRNDGYAKIRVENQDDLWYLKDIISEGDKVCTLTQRTKLDGREKKTLKLTLTAEKFDYQEDRLRVTGEITEGGDQIELGYHTFNLEAEDEFEIWKNWSDEEWSRLKEAENKKSYSVLFCLVEKGKADLYIVKESGVKDLSGLEENIPGKMYDDQKTGDSFYNDLNEVLSRTSDKVDNIILCGPGFEKNKVYNNLSDELKEMTFVQDTSVTGRTGLHEAIKRGALKKVVESSRIDEETSVLEDFFERLQDDGNVSYGEPIFDLAEQGAVEKLLITQEKFRENQELVKNVERAGGKVQIVHTDHEAGERLENFSGIAALLRYKP
jgi:protein pelota